MSRSRRLGEYWKAGRVFCERDERYVVVDAAGHALRCATSEDKAALIAAGYTRRGVRAGYARRGGLR